MKKFIVSGVCTTLICFMLSSFTSNSNYLAGSDNSLTANYQDTTHKKARMSKTKMDTSAKASATTNKKKMHKEKKPA